MPTTEANLVPLQGLNAVFSADLMFRDSRQLKAQRVVNGCSFCKSWKCKRCNAVARHQVNALRVSLSASMDCVASLGKGVTISGETRLAMNPDKLTECDI